MSHIFIVPIVLLNALYFLITKDILIEIVISLIFMVFILMYIRNSLTRKDTLNIIKHNNKVYFNLSDDIFFSIDMVKNDILDEITLSDIEKRILTVKEIISKVEFINFYDEQLYNRLNSLIHDN